MNYQTTMGPNINERRNVTFIIESDDEEDNETHTYYSRNKEAFRERYTNNIEVKRAYQNDYNLINNEKYTEYQRIYYEQRREKLLESKKEKVMCECGKMVSRGHMTCHKKSNSHIKRIQLK